MDYQQEECHSVAVSAQFSQVVWGFDSRLRAFLRGVGCNFSQNEFSFKSSKNQQTAIPLSQQLMQIQPGVATSANHHGHRLALGCSSIQLIFIYKASLTIKIVSGCFTEASEADPPPPTRSGCEEKPEEILRPGIKKSQLA